MVLIIEVGKRAANCAAAAAQERIIKITAQRRAAQVKNPRRCPDRNAEFFRQTMGVFGSVWVSGLLFEK